MKGFIAVTVCSLFALGTSAFAAGAIDELSAENQAKVRNGEMVTLTAPGGTWPKISIYQRVEATPEELMAVLSDFDRQKEFVPDVSYSKVEKRVDKATSEVGYTIQTHVSLHPRESYTLRDTLSTYDGGTSYRLDWKMISSVKIKDIVGNARMERLGNGTLVAYFNHITPPRMASGQADRAIAGVQKTVLALGERVAQLRADNQALLQQEIAALREAVAK